MVPCMQSTLCGFKDLGSIKGADLLQQFGPTLRVDIGFDEKFRANGGRPELAVKDVHALVDTGASTNCIDSDLAMTLDLPIVDQARVAGISGPKIVNVHLAQVYIHELDEVIYEQLVGVDLSAGGQPHSALIGRSFLRNFKMVYDGALGEVMICEPDAIDVKMQSGKKEKKKGGKGA